VQRFYLEITCLSLLWENIQMVEGVTGHPEESYRKKSYILIVSLYKRLISTNKITLT